MNDERTVSTPTFDVPTGRAEFCGQTHPHASHKPQVGDYWCPGYTPVDTHSGARTDDLVERIVAANPTPPPASDVSVVCKSPGCVKTNVNSRGWCPTHGPADEPRVTDEMRKQHAQETIERALRPADTHPHDEALWTAASLIHEGLAHITCPHENGIGWSCERVGKDPTNWCWECMARGWLAKYARNFPGPVGSAPSRSAEPMRCSSGVSGHFGPFVDKNQDGDYRCAECGSVWCAVCKSWWSSDSAHGMTHRPADNPKQG